MFNLYYKEKLINTKGAVDDSVIEHIKNKPFIFKVTEDVNGVVHRERIPTSMIKIVKTYVF